jgi:hypothetical protein
MESYIFMESCGCGSTRIFLEINDNTFTIRDRSDWMGYMGPVWFKYTGIIEQSSVSPIISGYINTAQFMIKPYYLGNKQLYVGDIYTVPPHTINVSFTRFAEKKMTDNALMPRDGVDHLGYGGINMGNGANYNAEYQMEMKFTISAHSTHNFDPYSREGEGEQAQLDAINVMIHPDEQFLPKIMNQLHKINYVQMGQLDGNTYEERDDQGKVHIQFEKSALDPHEL